MMASKKHLIGLTFLVASAGAIRLILTLDVLLHKPGFLDALPLQSFLMIAFLACLILLYFSIHVLPIHYVVYLAIALIPLEISAPIGFFPKLSPIDYLAALSCVAVIAKYGFRQFIEQAWSAFPRGSGIFFALFVIFGVADAILLKGSMRGPLRWGEFLFFFVLASMAVRQTPIKVLGRAVVNVLSVAGAIVSILTICQFAASGGHATNAYATFGHRNVMAAFLSFCLPACSAVQTSTAPLWGTLRKASSFLMLCAFVISYSRGAWMGLALGVLCVYWLLRHHQPLNGTQIRNALLTISIFFAPLSTIVILRNTEKDLLSFSQRPIYWSAAYSIVREQPWFGLGPGNYEKELPDILSGRARDIYDLDMTFSRRNAFWQSLHSLYLQVVVEYGLVGFLLWVLALGFLLRAAFRSLFDSTDALTPYFMMSLIAYLIHNTVDVLTVSSLDLLFAFFSAIILFSQKEKIAPPTSIP